MTNDSVTDLRAKARPHKAVQLAQLGMINDEDLWRTPWAKLLACMALSMPHIPAGKQDGSTMQGSGSLTTVIYGLAIMLACLAVEENQHGKSHVDKNSCSICAALLRYEQSCMTSLNKFST